MAVVAAEKDNPSRIYRRLLLPRTPGRLNVAGGETVCVVWPTMWW